MKKLFVMIAFGFMLAIAACSNSTQEAKDKCTSDSLRCADSIANCCADTTTLPTADSVVVK